MNNIEQLNISGRKILRRPPVDPTLSKGTLIMLHGYGADEYDLMGLAAYFDENLQVLSIRGPGSTVHGGASWFDIDMNVDGSLKFNTGQALESADSIIDLIQVLREQGIITDEKIILAGFSQGATISQLVTLQKPEIIKALLILSGRLTDEATELLENQEALTGLPVFAAHGAHDNVIPIEFGRQIVSFWEKLPVQLETHEYPMGHEISQDELVHIQNWMGSVVFT
jgi:phospholipase/carboxylesterase